MWRSALLAALLCAGCGEEALPNDFDAAVSVDAGMIDLATVCETGNACGDCDPSCHSFSLGPLLGKPFPLCAMAMDPNESVIGLLCDQDGFLEIPPPYVQPIWLPNATDWNRGTVSKFDPTHKQEIARYFSVTCASLPGGSADPCDGTKGCCALDDDPRWQARRTNQPEPPHQAVTWQNASPSRTAVDWNGVLWIANRAPDGIGSITKIAFDPSQCIDRNGDKTIETSHDANGDGLIETDCNGDGLPDDLATVAAAPCKNGASQEFFGLDDECVLSTTNVGAINEAASAVTMGPGVNDFGPQDPWVSTIYEKVVRVDGTSGLTTDERELPQGCSPFGMATDATPIVWAVTEHTGPFCWFDPKSSDVGVVRVPDFGTSAWGLAIDRDQNVWLGGDGNADAYRYTPDRSQKNANLGNGWWTKVANAGAGIGVTGSGRGIFVDSRSPQFYFAWLTTDEGYLVGIPASTIAIQKNDQLVDGSAWPAVTFGKYREVAVTGDSSGDLWAVDTSTAIHVAVDANGKMTQPEIDGPPMGNVRCPTGDSCTITDVTPPGTEAYSDFGTIQLRETALSVKVRTGKTPIPDNTWSAWTVDSNLSPVDLATALQEMFGSPAWQYLQVELDAKTLDEHVTPTLESFTVTWKCSP